jgi:hypothetical protein
MEDEIADVDCIDVVGAQSVLEVAEVVAAVLGARMEMGGEPGRIVVTGAPDTDLRVVIGLAINDRGLPERWTRRITIAHDRSSDELLCCPIVVPQNLTCTYAASLAGFEPATNRLTRDRCSVS